MQPDPCTVTMPSLESTGGDGGTSHVVACHFPTRYDANGGRSAAAPLDGHRRVSGDGDGSAQQA